MLECSGYVSNSTYDKCIGNVIINSPEVAGTLFFGMIFIVGFIWAMAYVMAKTEDKDANHSKGVEK